MKLARNIETESVSSRYPFPPRWHRASATCSPVTAFFAPRKDFPMVRLRFKRFGRTHKPFYRLCAIDQRAPRDGAAIEELGWYDPTNPDAEKQTSLDLERIRHWIGTGAQPSETVSDLLVKHGVLDKDTRKLAKS